MSNTREDITIDVDDLQGEFVKQSGLYYYYSSKLEEVRESLYLEKVAMEILEAKLSISFRTSTTNSNRVTESQVLSHIKTSPEWEEKQKQLAALKKAEGQYKAIVESLIHKKDMLIQLGAAKRSEYGADVAIRDLDRLKSQAEKVIKSRG